jgi:hypothetical protein
MIPKSKDRWAVGLAISKVFEGKSGLIAHRNLMG